MEVLSLIGQSNVAAMFVCFSIKYIYREFLSQISNYASPRLSLGSKCSGIPAYITGPSDCAKMVYEVVSFVSLLNSIEIQF